MEISDLAPLQYDEIFICSIIILFFLPQKYPTAMEIGFLKGLTVKRRLEKKL